jgi:hypothetical protein
VTGAEPV